MVLERRLGCVSRSRVPGVLPGSCGVRGRLLLRRAGRGAGGGRPSPGNSLEANAAAWEVGSGPTMLAVRPLRAADGAQSQASRVSEPNVPFNP